MRPPKTNNAKRFLGFLACVAFCVFLACSRVAPAATGTSDVPNVVTADIQAGIEKYIEERTRQGDGHFRFRSDNGEEFAFKLVRVHTEYLSNLGPRRHFACVDMVDTKGDVYDVDFFLSGDAGDMTVTETILHKLNGKPFYYWEQMEDRTWHRVPADSASRQLLEIVEGRDTFEFRYTFTIPAFAQSARMWLPYPRSDSFQRIQLISLTAPASYKVIEDAEYGNRIFFFRLGPDASGKKVEIRYRVERIEKAAYSSEGEDVRRFLRPERLVPLTDEIIRVAQEVVSGKKGDLVRARALYDHVIEHIQYAKYGGGYGRGDAVYACNAGFGNCTDYHAYFNALTRAVGIPSRFAIGAGIPASRNDGGIDGYHCWAEFYAEGKWWPVDISEADKYTDLATYYFGRHPANRIEISRGRDIEIIPGPASGHINFLAYPILEVAGRLVNIVPQFSFKRLP